MNVRRSRLGDIITTQRIQSTKRWFHLPPGTPLERITLSTAKKPTEDAVERLKWLRSLPRAR